MANEILIIYFCYYKNPQKVLSLFYFVKIKILSDVKTTMLQKGHSSPISFNGIY